MMNKAGKFFELFTDRIWTVDTSACPKAYAALVKHIKVIRITIDTFTQNRMGFQCVALSYFVTLAIIPLITFIFAITGDLGLSEKISELLHRFFANNPEYIDVLMNKANELLETAKSGGLGFASALTLIWAVLWMMFQVERVFNNVWGIRKIPRKVFTRFGFYRPRPLGPALPSEAARLHGLLRGERVHAVGDVQVHSRREGQIQLRAQIRDDYGCIFRNLSVSLPRNPDVRGTAGKRLWCHSRDSAVPRMAEPELADYNAWGRALLRLPQC